MGANDISKYTCVELCVFVCEWVCVCVGVFVCYSFFANTFLPPRCWQSYKWNNTRISKRNNCNFFPIKLEYCDTL